MKLGDMRCPWHPNLTLFECKPLHEDPEKQQAYVEEQRKREEEHYAHEAACLARRECPAGGGHLSTWGNVRIPEGTLSCGVCDCFGYDPEEVGQPGSK